MTVYKTDLIDASVLREHPLDLYDSEIRSLDVNKDFVAGHGDPNDVLLSEVDEFIRPWVVSMMKKFFSDHLESLTNTRFKMPTSQHPRAADYSLEFKNFQLPSDIEPFDFKKYTKFVVRIWAAYFGTPRVNIAQTIIGTLPNFAIEKGDRQLEARDILDDSEIINLLSERYGNTVIPGLVALILICLKFRVTPEQRRDFSTRLRDCPKFARGATIHKYLFKYRPYIEAAKWDWEDIYTWLLTKMPDAMCSHNSLASVESLADFTEKAQIWCDRFPNLVPESEEEEPFVGNTTASQTKTCSKHGQGTHDTSECRQLNGTANFYCTVHKNNYTHNTEQCRNQKRNISASDEGTNKRSRTGNDISCFRCLEPHHRKECPSDKAEMIKSLLKLVTNPPADNSRFTCSRCGGTHGQSRCGVTDAMVSAYNAAASQITHISSIATPPETSGGGDAIEGSQMDTTEGAVGTISHVDIDEFLKDYPNNQLPPIAKSL